MIGDIHFDIVRFLRSKGHKVLSNGFILGHEDNSEFKPTINIGRFSVDKYREEMGINFNNINKKSEARNTIENIILNDNLTEFYEKVSKLDEYLTEVIKFYVINNKRKYKNIESLKLIYHSDIDGRENDDMFEGSIFKNTKLPLTDANEFIIEL